MSVLLKVIAGGRVSEKRRRALKDVGRNPKPPSFNRVKTAPKNMVAMGTEPDVLTEDEADAAVYEAETLEDSLPTEDFKAVGQQPALIPQTPSQLDSSLQDLFTLGCQNGIAVMSQFASQPLRLETSDYQHNVVDFDRGTFQSLNYQYNLDSVEVHEGRYNGYSVASVGYANSIKEGHYHRGSLSCEATRKSKTPKHCQQKNVSTKPGRRDMEDAEVAVAIGKGIAFWVFDGHGERKYEGGKSHGAATSSFAAEKLPAYFRELLEGDCTGNPLKALYVATTRTNNELMDTQAGKQSGTTVVGGYICGNRLSLENVGDSRAVLVTRHERLFDDKASSGSAQLLLDKSTVYHLSADHTVDNGTFSELKKRETRRIKAFGGKIRQDLAKKYRVCYLKGDSFKGGLATSRSLGHGEWVSDLDWAAPEDHNGIISGTPDLYSYKLFRGDEFVVNACDGLWDVVAPLDISRIIEKCGDHPSPADIVQALLKTALERGSTDNISIQVVDLREKV